MLLFAFDPSYLRENEFLERQIKSSRRRRRNVENEQTLSISVRTRKDDALLWRAEDKLGNYTQIQVNFS